MKKFLLLAGISAVSFAAFAEVPTPLKIDDAFVYSVSPNGKYGVSNSYGGMKILDLTKESQNEAYVYPDYQTGIGRTISNNGIAVGSMEGNSAEYWKDGEWYPLPLPANAGSTNLSNSITPDGKRICGSIGFAEMIDAFDGDAIMQVPCVWNATEDGYGMPVMLPYPKVDILGRAPQYVTAVDISEDGKTVIGQVVISTGFLNYPIVYKEDEEGNWMYLLPYYSLINPDYVLVPDNPGDAPEHVEILDYMTSEDLEAYQAAMAKYDEEIDKYYEVGDWDAPYPEYPNFEDFMGEENLAAYQAAQEKYDEEYAAWDEEYMKYSEAIDKICASSPNPVYNSIRLTPDGKKFAYTCYVEDDSDPDAWFPKVYSYNWVFDLTRHNITKYEKLDDLAMYFLGDNGTMLACNLSGEVTQSYILENGYTIPVQSWISSMVAPYGEWMDENLSREIENWYFDPTIGEDGEWIQEYYDAVVTGRATATPDFSKVVLSVEDLEYVTDGTVYVFDIAEGVADVNAVEAVKGEETIYDLSGRKLNRATAPGIYIVNGQKKVVR